MFAGFKVELDEFFEDIFDELFDVINSDETSNTIIGRQIKENYLKTLILVA